MHKSNRGRPPAAAPEGRYTIAEAAKKLGMSYSGFYKYLKLVPSTKDKGVVTITEGTLDRIRAMREEHATGGEFADGRRAIQVRPALERYEAWEEAAGEKPVSTWLGEIADAAAGYERG